MMQQAGIALQMQVAPAKREEVAKAIQADAKGYSNDVAPMARERAVKLAPASIGPMLEERFNEDELKQIVAWLESPVVRRYQQLAPDMERVLSEKLVPEL